MTIDPDDVAHTGHRCELDGEVVEDREGVGNPGTPIRRIDGVERAPKREVAPLIVTNIEDDDVAGVANADLFPRRLAEEYNQTARSEARLQP